MSIQALLLFQFNGCYANFMIKHGAEFLLRHFHRGPVKAWTWPEGGQSVLYCPCFCAVLFIRQADTGHQCAVWEIRAIGHFDTCKISQTVTAGQAPGLRWTLFGTVWKHVALYQCAPVIIGSCTFFDIVWNQIQVENVPEAFRDRSNWAQKPDMALRWASIKVLNNMPFSEFAPGQGLDRSLLDKSVTNLLTNL